MQCNRLLRKKEQAAKRHENATTFRLWNGKFVGLLP